MNIGVKLSHLLRDEPVEQHPELRVVEALALAALAHQVLQAVPPELAVLQQQLLERLPQLRGGVRQQAAGHVWVRLTQQLRWEKGCIRVSYAVSLG